MKKLMALIVIIMLAASYILVAEAVTNPFSFSVYNQITLKAVDTSQVGRMPDDDSDISYSPEYDFNTTKANLNDEMKCSASITIAEIYTMGFYLKGVGEYGFGGDAMRTTFYTGMTNSIKAVPDYLTIDINADYQVRWQAVETATTKTVTYAEGSLVSEAEYASYLDEIDVAGAPHNVDFDDDAVMNEADSWEIIERDLEADSTDTILSGDHVNLLLTPSLALSGGIPDTGFTWKLSEEIEMLWNPENGKDTDPTYQSWDGEVYDSATGLLITDETGENAPKGLQEGAFEYAEFKSQVLLEWEFFHFFAPENITCTLSLKENLNVLCPYSYYLEKDKRLRTEGYWGVKFGLAGVNIGIFVHTRTDDFLNTSAPLDGDNGSFRNWDGSWNAYDSNSEWSDIDATSHARPDMRIGPDITFGYSKDWISFGLEYLGYLDGIRKWDEARLNSVLIWNNEFSINVKISL